MTGAKLIKHYEELVAKDPRNLQLLQKLGEACQKGGDMVKAADAFLRVAEEYARDGFFLKAVALMKQCLKLDPSLNAVNLRLAELHAQLQLEGEALHYASAFLKGAAQEGEAPDALVAARLRVRLSHRPEFRLHLVQLLVHSGDKVEAATELAFATKAMQTDHPDLAATAAAITFTPGPDTTQTELAQLSQLRDELSRRTSIDLALTHLDRTHLH